MKSILVSGLLFCLIGLNSFVVGQDRKREEKISASTNDQIEVITDRFTQKTTLALKPQILLDKPDHFVTLTIKTKVSKSDDLYSMAYITSQAKVPQDFGGREAGFLVNNEPLTFNTDLEGDIPLLLEAKYYIEKDSMPRKKAYIGHPFEAQFKKISEAETIEMKFGAFETKFSQTAVANLREYARLVLEQASNVGK